MKSAPDPTPGFPLGAFASELETVKETMLTSVDKLPFRRRIFTPFLEKRYTVDLMQPIVTQIQPYGQVFSAEEVLQRFLDQDSAGQSNHSDNPSRWAFVNAFFARGMLERIESRSLANMSILAWTHFKNAFDVFPELVIQTTEIAACETLLVMTLFMLCSADDRTSSQLAGTAAQLVLGLGMQQEAYYSNMDTTVAERHRCIFWLTNILNIDLMHRCGLPSPIRHVDIDAELPTLSQATASGDGMGSNLLRYRAELAVVQSQIHEIPHRRDLVRREIPGCLENVDAIWQDLQYWKASIGDELRFNEDDNENDDGNYTQSVAEISLMGTYHSCAMKLQIVATRILRSGNVEMGPNTKQENIAQAHLGADQALEMCYASAHALLNLINPLSRHPFPSIWYMHIFLYVSRSDNYIGRRYVILSLRSWSYCTGFSMIPTLILHSAMLTT